MFPVVALSMLFLSICSPLSDYKLSNITYDLNGNLLTLTRTGQQPVSLAMDQLTYHYPLSSGHRTNNRLDHVSDAQSTTAYTSEIQVPAGQATQNYRYTTIGQLGADVLEARYYTYYGNGRVDTVYSDNNHTVALASFTYDASGNRLCKTAYASNGTTPIERTWYLRDASGALLSYYKQDLTTSSSVDEELPIPGVGSYLRTSGQVRYELRDHLGNTRVSFTYDGSAITVMEAHDYYPHGGLLPGRQLSSVDGSPLAYQGQEYDSEVGLTAFNLRQYDARLGRWLAPDPYRQHFSPYLAMGNDPVISVDPGGGYDRIFIDGVFMPGYQLTGLLERFERMGVIFDLEIFATDDYGRVSYSEQFQNVKMVNGIIKSAENREAKLLEVKSAYRVDADGNYHKVTVGLYSDPWTGDRFAEEHGGATRSRRPLGSFADRLRIIHDRAEEREDFHESMNYAGLIPGAGEPFDAVNALSYLFEGDLENAAWSGPLLSQL